MFVTDVSVEYRHTEDGPVMELKMTAGHLEDSPSPYDPDIEGAVYLSAMPDHMRGLMGFMLRTWANELEEALAYNPQIA